MKSQIEILQQFNFILNILSDLNLKLLQYNRGIGQSIDIKKLCFAINVLRELKDDVGNDFDNRLFELENLVKLANNEDLKDYLGDILKE